MGNNVAEFIVQARVEGTGEVQNLAISMDAIDKLAGRLAFSFASATAGQEAWRQKTQQASDATRGAQTNLLGLNGAVGILQQSLGVGFTIGGLYALANSAAETVRSIGQIADIMDTTTEKASKLYLAVEKTGRSPELLRMTALMADTALQQARAGSPLQANAFAQLGIDPTKIQGSYDLIMQLIDAYHQNITVDGQLLTQDQKIADMKVLLGKSLKDLLPLFEEGTTAIEKENGLTAEQIAKAKEFTATIARLREQLKLGIGLLLVELIDGHTKIIALTAAVIGLAQAGRALKSAAFLEWIATASQYLGAFIALQTGAAAGSAALFGLVGAGAVADVALIAADVDAVMKLRQAWKDADQAVDDYDKLVEKAHQQFATPAKSPFQQDLRDLDLATEKLDALKQKRKAYIDEAASDSVEAGKRAQQGPVVKQLDAEIAALEKQAADLRSKVNVQRPAPPPPTAPGAAPIVTGAPDPKIVNASWAAILETEKAQMAARQSQRESAVKDLTKPEADADAEHLADQLKYNALERQAAVAEVAAVIEERKKLPAFEQVQGNKNFDDLVAQQAKLAAHLEVLYADEDKIRADAAAKGFALTQKQAEFDAQQQIKLAEDTGNKVLAISLRFADERRKAQETLGRPLTPGESATFDISQTYATNAAQFDQKLKDLSATVALYQQKINDTNQALAAHSVETSQARANIQSYERSIHDAIENALPELTRFLNAIKELAKQHPELKIDTTALEATLAKWQEKENRTPVKATSQLQQLRSEWSDLNAQIDHTATTSLQAFANTGSKALLDMAENTGKAREAFRSLANEVIQGLIQMMIQQTIAHVLGLAQSREAATTQATSNAQITASAAPAAATQAAATFGANAAGVLLILAVIAAAIGVLAATRRAEGGPVYGAGTATSDSIPAMLSHGEYVHQAAAHDYYGTPAMDAINARAIPREAIHAALARRSFSEGGMAAFSDRRSSLPSFASGGVVVRLAGGGAVPDVNVAAPVVMLGIGDAEIGRIVASSAMQKALFDNAAKNAVRTSRLVHRHSGHRGQA